MTATKVATLGELIEGTPLAVTVDGTDIVLVRAGDEVHALADECSHAAVKLSEGESAGCELTCWLHGARFDIRTGAALCLPAMQPVSVYPVTLDGEDVLVDVDTPLETKEK